MHHTTEQFEAVLAEIICPSNALQSGSNPTPSNPPGIAQVTDPEAMAFEAETKRGEDYLEMEAQRQMGDQVTRLATTPSVLGSFPMVSISVRF